MSRETTHTLVAAACGLLLNVAWCGPVAGQGAGGIPPLRPEVWRAEGVLFAEIANNSTPTGHRLRGTNLNGRELFVNLTDLGRYLSADDRWDFKNKYELIAGNRRLKFTLGSPIVVLDNMPGRSVNLHRPVILHQGSLYAPAGGMATLLSVFTGQECEFIPERNWLNFGGTGFNLLGVEIMHRADQGTEVRIQLTEPLDYEQFMLDSEGVLGITFPGARANLAALGEVRGVGLIRRMEVISQRDDVLQLTFHLNRRYSGRPVFIRSGTDLIFQLRNASAGEPIAATAESSARAFKIQTIVIDAGHGGRDPGSIGPTGLQEKEVALDVALRLKERLESDPRMQDIQVVMTRETDVFIPLSERYRIANEARGDLFVSIHANAYHDRTANGFMTFFLAEANNDDARHTAALENSAIQFEERPGALALNDGDILKGILGELISTKYLEESQMLASVIQDEMRGRIGTQVRPRRVDQAGFWVLNGAMMPGVLVEMAFISNRTEEGLLRQTAFRNKVAEALHAALVTYRARVEVNR